MEFRELGEDRDNSAVQKKDGQRGEKETYRKKE